MNTYEIFADGFSVIIQADNLHEALTTFEIKHTTEIIAAVDRNHPIAAEFGLAYEPILQAVTDICPYCGSNDIVKGFACKGCRECGHSYI